MFMHLVVLTFVLITFITDTFMRKTYHHSTECCQVGAVVWAAVKYVWTVPVLCYLPANCNVMEMPMCFGES
jgi:hypothetical protein